MTHILERPEVTVACIVTRDIDDATNFLLGACRESLSFPGGWLEGDESPQEAAIRELEDATGLFATDALPLGYWSYDRNEQGGYHCVTLYFMMLLEDDDQELDEEALGWEWFDPHALPGEDRALPRDAKFYSDTESVLWMVS